MKKFKLTRKTTAISFTAQQICGHDSMPLAHQTACVFIMLRYVPGSQSLLQTSSPFHLCRTLTTTVGGHPLTRNQTKCFHLEKKNTTVCVQTCRLWKRKTPPQLMIQRSFTHLDVHTCMKQSRNSTDILRNLTFFPPSLQFSFLSFPFIWPNEC